MNGGIVSLMRNGFALHREPTRQPQQIIKLEDQAGNTQTTTDPDPDRNRLVSSV